MFASLPPSFAAARSLRAPLAVLFDWDGTLVDSWPVIHESMNRTLSAMGYPAWSFEETVGRARRSLRDAFPELFGERWREARDVFYAEYRRLHLDRIKAIDGAEELIEACRSLGCRLGVVSNKSGRHLREESAHLGWDGYFAGRLVGAADAARDKPAVEPVTLALAGTDVVPSPDVWFVGDTWVDMACGRAAGCLTVLVGGADPGGEEFENCRPDAHFSSCRDLLEVVMRLGDSISSALPDGKETDRRR